MIEIEKIKISLNWWKIALVIIVVILFSKIEPAQATILLDKIINKLISQ
ncbi:hypothetical protein [Urechidicola croceus]|nr:hypothetical protein [Urechidicola croceus]